MLAVSEIIAMGYIQVDSFEIIFPIVECFLVIILATELEKGNWTTSSKITNFTF